MYCWAIPAVQSNFEELARKLWENPPNKLLLGMPTVTNRVEFCFFKKDGGQIVRECGDV